MSDDKVKYQNNLEEDGLSSEQMNENDSEPSSSIYSSNEVKFVADGATKRLRKVIQKRNQPMCTSKPHVKRH